MTNLNKTIAVTGASSGIGFATAKAYYDQGANVILNGRDQSKLANALHEFSDKSKIAIVAGDIGDKSTGSAVVEIAKQRFGGIDVLVNNAGSFGLKAFLDVTEQDLDDFLNGNLKGTYFTTQAVVAYMKEQAIKGSIVNIGTVLIDHASAGIPASAALVSKGGVHAFTKALAAELASDGIRVNAVAPGIIKTPLHGQADVESLKGLALLNQVGEVRHIAEAVMYLAGSEFITGHILNVDGGYVSGRT